MMKMNNNTTAALIAFMFCVPRVHAMESAFIRQMQQCTPNQAFVATAGIIGIGFAGKAVYDYKSNTPPATTTPKHYRRSDATNAGIGLLALATARSGVLECPLNKIHNTTSTLVQNHPYATVIGLTALVVITGRIKANSDYRQKSNTWNNLPNDEKTTKIAEKPSRPVESWCWKKIRNMCS
ncbi:MAG: hypothetical protein WC707_06405 [Candidatus Babeliaceae bacterium]|jgi:hypothetical protein